MENVIHVDFKESIWLRVSVNKEREDFVLDLLKSKQISNADDLIEQLDPDDYLVEGHLLETSEQLSVFDNDGQSTIDVTDPNGVVSLFDNSDNSLSKDSLSKEKVLNLLHHFKFDYDEGCTIEEWLNKNI